MEKLVDTVIAFTARGRLARGRSVSGVRPGRPISRSLFPASFPARALICQWRTDASGALICVWSSDDPSATGDTSIAACSRAA